MAEERFPSTPTPGLTPTTTNPSPEEKKEEEKKEKVRIIDITRVPSADPKRLGKFDIVIVYMTEDGRTYMVSVPEEEFSEEKLPEIIKADIEKRRRLIGKEIVI